GESGRNRRCHERQHGERENEISDRYYHEIGEEKYRRDEIKIPIDKQQRSNPGRQRNRCSASETAAYRSKESPRPTQQQTWQKWIRGNDSFKASKHWIGQQHDGAHHGE